MAGPGFSQNTARRAFVISGGRLRPAPRPVKADSGATGPHCRPGSGVPSKKPNKLLPQTLLLRRNATPLDRAAAASAVMLKAVYFIDHPVSISTVKTAPNLSLPASKPWMPDTGPAAIANHDLLPASMPGANRNLQIYRSIPCVKTARAPLVPSAAAAGFWLGLGHLVAVLTRHS